MTKSEVILKNNAQKLFDRMVRIPNKDLISDIVVTSVNEGFYTEFHVKVFITKKAVTDIHKEIVRQREKLGSTQMPSFDDVAEGLESKYFQYGNQIFNPYLTRQLYEVIQYVKPGIHSVVPFKLDYRPTKKIDDSILNLGSIIKEETEGIDSFLTKIISTYPQTETFISNIKSFIDKSNCKRIEVAKFKYPALGIALHNGVMFNEQMFNLPLDRFLFVIFHEIAHQYQYKKYGDDKMYEFYTDEIDVKDAAKAMKEIEIIADEFATRKIREFVKLGFIKKPIFNYSGPYKSTPLSQFEQLINFSKEKIKEKGDLSPQTIADTFYNIIKANTQ